MNLLFYKLKGRLTSSPKPVFFHMQPSLAAATQRTGPNRGRFTNLKPKGILAHCGSALRALVCHRIDPVMHFIYCARIVSHTTAGEIHGQPFAPFYRRI
jgi:hypothetical protein